MNIYFEESGTPFASISSEPNYFVLTATKFSSNINIKEILVSSKEKFGIPINNILHGRELKRQSQIGESLFKEIFSHDWKDTKVVSVVLDKSQTQANKESYPSILATAVNLALSRHKVTNDEVNLITDNPLLFNEEMFLRQQIPLLDEVFQIRDSSVRLQVADLITYAIYRKFSFADNTLFQHISHLVIHETPIVSQSKKGILTSLEPYKALILGGKIVELRYKVNEASKVKVGKNIFKPSSKSEYFSSLIAGLRPFSNLSDLPEYIRDLHQYIFEASNGGKSLQSINTETFPVFDELNRLRVFFSHDLEQDKDSPEIIQAKYQRIGEIFKEFTGTASPPKNTEDCEKLRFHLLGEIEKMLSKILESL